MLQANQCKCIKFGNVFCLVSLPVNILMSNQMNSKNCMYIAKHKYILIEHFNDLIKSKLNSIKFKVHQKMIVHYKYNTFTISINTL